MNKTMTHLTVCFLAGLLFPAPSLCVPDPSLPHPSNPNLANAPEPLWLFDNVETDYVSTPVLALRKALRDQVRKERDPATLRKDRAEADRAEQEGPGHYIDAWVESTEKEDTFSPEMRRLRKELREQIRRERAEHEPKTREEAEALIKRFSMIQTAQVTLKGTVTDEQGHPLNGVGLTIVERHGTMTGNSGNHPERNITRRVRVDGEFSLVCNDVYSVHLTFRARDYFKLDRRFDVPQPPTYLPIEKGKKVEFDNIHMVMEKAGQRARLKTYDADLTAYLERPGSVADLSLMGGRKRDISRKVLHGESVDFPRVFVEVAYPDGQSAPADSNQFARDVRSGRARVSLCLKDSQDGGFIVVNRGKKYFPQVMRDLAEAPAQGYRSRIDFTPSQAEHLWDGVVLPFFIRADGRYGKGGLYFMQSWKSFGVRTSIELNMQPDGSRNLLTRE